MCAVRSVTLQAALTRAFQVTRSIAWSLPQKNVFDGRMYTVNLLSGIVLPN